MKRSRLGRLILATAAPVVISCQLLLDRDPLRPDPDPSSQPDARAREDPCSHAAAPSAPAVDDDPATANDYWFATERIIVPTMEDGGVKPGVDLDDSCTCQRDLRDGAPSCETPATERAACDFDGGVDDSFGTATLQYTGVLRDHDLGDVVNQRMATGYRTFLVYLSGYNGKENDPAVDVGFVTSGGLYDQARCGDPELPVPPSARESLMHPPRWDGCDRWSPVPGHVVGEFPNRRTTTMRAYVTNYRLIVPITSVSAGILGEELTMTHGVAVATLIAETTGRFRLEGFLAGRLAFTDVAALVGGTDFSRDGGKVPLCTTEFWPLVTSQLCTARDTMQQAARDFQGQVCDAVTATIGFVARQAQVSNDVYQHPQAVVQCDAAVDCR